MITVFLSAPSEIWEIRDVHSKLSSQSTEVVHCLWFSLSRTMFAKGLN